jgi:hypothetical protein
MGLLDWLPFRKTRFPIGLIEESLRECPKCGEAYLVSAGAFYFGLIDSKRRCNGCRSHDGKEPCPDWIPVIKPQAIYRRWGGEAEAMAAIHQALLSYFQYPRGPRMTLGRPRITRMPKGKRMHCSASYRGCNLFFGKLSSVLRISSGGVRRADAGKRSQNGAPACCRQQARVRTRTCAAPNVTPSST